MSIDTVTTILIAMCPTISAVTSAAIGFIGLARTIKSVRKDNEQTVVKSTQNLDRMDKKLSTLNTKVASIEKYLVEEKEKRK